LEETGKLEYDSQIGSVSISKVCEMVPPVDETQAEEDHGAPAAAVDDDEVQVKVEKEESIVVSPDVVGNHEESNKHDDTEDNKDGIAVSHDGIVNHEQSTHDDIEDNKDDIGVSHESREAYEQDPNDGINNHEENTHDDDEDNKDNIVLSHAVFGNDTDEHDENIIEDGEEDIEVSPDIIEPNAYEEEEDEEEQGRGKRKRTRRGTVYEYLDLDYEDEGPPKRKKKKKHRSTVQELDDDHNKVYSRSKADVCTSSCNICGKVGYHDAILKHITNIHKETVIDNYKMLTRTFYKCRICDAEMVFFVSRIKEHVKRKHKMTLQEYKDDFNELTEKVPTRPLRVPGEETDVEHARCKLCGFIAEEDETRQHVQNVHSEPASLDFYEFVSKEEVKEQETIWKAQTEFEEMQELIEHWRHTVVEGAPPYFTDNSKDKCLRQCNFCDKVYSEDSMRGHMRKHHPDEKKGDHPMIRLTFHRCRVCQKELRFTFNIVQKHLKKNHNLKMTEYRALCHVFLDQEDPSLYNANSNPEEIMIM